MIAFPKISPLLPLLLMLIVGIFIVERRVRFVNNRCNDIDIRYNELKSAVYKHMCGGDAQTDPPSLVTTTEQTVGKDASGVILTAEVCIAPPHIISVQKHIVSGALDNIAELASHPKDEAPHNLVEAAEVEIPKTTIVVAQPCTDTCPIVLPEEKVVSKKKAPSSENELVDLLKSVDAIQDITKPVVTKKTDEEKQLKQVLRAKGLSCKGTIEELRARAKEVQQ